jgi:hypothetical protein
MREICGFGGKIEFVNDVNKTFDGVEAVYAKL